MADLPELPDKAWMKIVNTACDTFKQLMLPITATTNGVGKIIKVRFDQLEAEMKEEASEFLLKVNEKVARSGYDGNVSANRKTILQSFDEAVVENDAILKELWANLLTDELIAGGVHPEFLMILKRLSSEDALLLSRISRSNVVPETLSYLKEQLKVVENKLSQLAKEIEQRHISSQGKYIPSKMGRGMMLKRLDAEKQQLLTRIDEMSSTVETGKEFSHRHLLQLGLIESAEGTYRLTELGVEFIKVVSDKPRK